MDAERASIRIALSSYINGGATADDVALAIVGAIRTEIAAAICARQEQRAEPSQPQPQPLGDPDWWNARLWLAMDEAHGAGPTDESYVDAFRRVARVYESARPQPSGEGTGQDDACDAYWLRTMASIIRAGIDDNGICRLAHCEATAQQFDALAARVEELGRERVSLRQLVDTKTMRELAQEKRAHAAERKLAELSARPHPDRAAIVAEVRQQIAGELRAKIKRYGGWAWVADVLDCADRIERGEPLR